MIAALPASANGAALAVRAKPPRRSDVDVDVVVVGGGVNGLGVARDASKRGLKVALFERNDLAFGASGNSSGMIHGGVRYLTYDPHVTETSCRDSGHIQAIAPHLLFRIPFLIPVENTRKGRFLYPLMDAFFAAYDQYQPLKRGKPHARLTPDELHALEPGLAGDLTGGFSMDEWGIDGARLCVANAVDAMEHGARISVGTTVERIEPLGREGGGYFVEYRDRVSGRADRIRASVVVNATGAWAPITASLAGLAPAHARVRPGKGVHVVYDRRLTNYAIFATTIDGRQIFLEPWENMSVLGTTDDDFYGDLDRVHATSEEVRYLVEGIARIFPAIHEARAIGTYAGVRPTLYAFGPSEDALSREHEIVDHAKHGAPGLYSMIGGKLASYRLFAEAMTDILARVFDLGVSCSTHTSILPGGDMVCDPFALARRTGIDAVAARRLVYRHGSRAERIEERARVRPREAVTVCPCEPVIEAEVRYVLEHELARSVADVSRRTRLGLGACGGMRCAARCGQIVAEELQLDPREGMRQALTFLERQALTRSAALGPDQARQEALAIASVRSEIGVGAGDEGEEEAML
jgi:glycerol-3-phosphate dehydrogenase